MRIRDLHELPRLRDGLSYLYLERGIIEQRQKSVEFFDKNGSVMVPASSLSLLMLGPGTSITHEAIKTLTDNGCLINWCGEDGVRFYAQGCGETRKGYKLLHQAKLVSDPATRMAVVRRMYQFRFDEALSSEWTLQQIRGMEGARVRRSYKVASEKYNVPWRGRRYSRQHWGAGDSINRAISAANACLNGLCHAAIVSAGYSPGLGFIHTGKQLSFVYDIADLYKAELTVPLAFELTAESKDRLETRVRHGCRDLFYKKRLLGRILNDIDDLLNLTREMDEDGLDAVTHFDNDPAQPGQLWDPETATEGVRQGGVNYAEEIFM